MNNKIREFVRKSKEVSTKMDKVYGECFTLYESFQEMFDTGGDFSIDPTDGNVTEADLLELGIVFADLKTAINQGFSNFVNYWTNQSVTTREYGKDLRSIMSY